MKKTVHIMNAMEIGGVEVGVLSLLKSKLQDKYHVVTVCGCNSEIYDSLSEQEKSRLHIGNGYFNALMLLLKLNPEIIVSSLWRAHLVSLLYKILRPSKQRIHFVHSARFAHFVDEMVTRLSISTSFEVFCDSNNTKKWLTKTLKRHESKVIPMNVSFSNKKITFYSAPVNFVYVGRFCKEKQLSKSLEFISRLAKTGINCTYDLYGRDDGELNLLMDYVEKNKLSKIVKFHDPILPTDIESEMRKYNYYLQSSFVEGMAISVFQSIKNGLFPVVTPVGEIKNYTQDGLNACYMNVDCIQGSAHKFIDMVSLEKVKNLRIGELTNKKDYPQFDESFFSALEAIGLAK